MDFGGSRQWVPELSHITPERPSQTLPACPRKGGREAGAGGGLYQVDEGKQRPPGSSSKTQLTAWVSPLCSESHRARQALSQPPTSKQNPSPPNSTPCTCKTSGEQRRDEEVGGMDFSFGTDPLTSCPRVLECRRCCCDPASGRFFPPTPHTPLAPQGPESRVPCSYPHLQVAKAIRGQQRSWYPARYRGVEGGWSVRERTISQRQRGDAS